MFRRKIRLAALPVSAVAILALVTFGMQGAANATTSAPLSVTLSACGSGSSAVWNASGNPVLTIGTAPAATCGAPAGSSYNPAFAQVGINVGGQAVPVSEPMFVTDSYASGSPRMVIELNNGNQLTGYPAASGLNGTDMAWAVGNSGTYTDYATAYTAVNASTTTIKDAFIVQDADQAPGTVAHLTGIQFGGATVQVVRSNVVQVKNRATGKCLNADQYNGLIFTYACLPGTYVSLRWQQDTFADGSKYLQSVQTGGFVKDNGQNNQLSLTNIPAPMRFQNGGIFRFSDNLVIGVNRQGNFVPVIGSPPYASLNNVRWDFSNA